MNVQPPVSLSKAIFFASAKQLCEMVKTCGISEELRTGHIYEYGEVAALVGWSLITGKDSAALRAP